jgi:probable HAF family extracellular repeat protein
VLYQDGEVIDLGQGRALAINKRRQVVGVSAFADTSRAFVYSDGQHQDLGTLGGESSIAVDINDAGDIVGDSLTANGFTRAFLYSGGVMAELPVPGEFSSARAINRHGQVVAVGSSPEPVDAYLYQDGHTALLRDLIPQDGCWKQLDARDINDHGDIVGIGIRNSDSSCGEVGRFLVVVTQRPQRYR